MPRFALGDGQVTKIFIPRSGLGFDAHEFSTFGQLILGGLPLKNFPALKGHSDGDSVTHALIDALLGAAGGGDIGELFPDTSPKWKGSSSLFMLDEVLALIRKKGWKPFNVDVTVVADKPRLSGYKLPMARLLARRLGIPAGAVNIKAKTAEGTRLLSERGGIAAWVLATLVPVKLK